MGKFRESRGDNRWESHAIVGSANSALWRPAPGRGRARAESAPRERRRSTGKRSAGGESGRASGLPSNQTSLESLRAELGDSGLEAALRAQLARAGLPQPLPARPYCYPIAGRRWRVDLCWPARRLVVEVEGGSWTAGRHTRGAGFEADCLKYNALTLAGWRVLRVTGAMIKDGRALALVRCALAEREVE